MDIEARIKRRRRRDGEPRLILEYESLSPVTHISEPVDRGPVLERLLDYLDPVFDGNLPPNAYVYGPKGSGKSAVVTALFSHLTRLLAERNAAIYTTTRAQSAISPAFVYVDARETTSEFAFYHAVLDALVEESVPEHGIGTETLKSRLHQSLGGSRTGVVVAIDHLGEPGNITEAEFVDLFAGLPSNVSWLAIGRALPSETVLTEYTAESIQVEPYQRQMLVDVLMTRASVGLAQQGLDHRAARTIAEWADGDAHDALAALFGAAETATAAGHDSIDTADLDAGIDAVPRPSVSLGRVLALPANRQRVLRRLLELNDDERSSVQEASEHISQTVDLSSTTVKRILYELAESGITRRVTIEEAEGKGRPPSRLEPRFPTVVFKRLFELNGGRE
ncbi:Cdc6-related protein, AAA superfamily ATPase [Halogranum rubrum]|uniref:Cdc6-related protein, AAA superfamily ATPase n=1 Tax=Halogranum rubrum TaxID=553466 RepID=A0A1I4J2J9_9EURY|nr:AAA family ATPase [Halogranum rubrum]SFL60842.1 Cdc6-related protein, AAA superfamily ATPase [Halogranum rubrum]